MRPCTRCSCAGAACSSCSGAWCGTGSITCTAGWGSPSGWGSTCWGAGEACGQTRRRAGGLKWEGTACRHRAERPSSSSAPGRPAWPPPTSWRATAGVPLVLEKGGRVGGISRTEVYKGYRFDIGGHRFHTGNEEVHALWRRMLGDDLLTVRRMTRIYRRGKMFAYPLKSGDILRNVGPLEACRMLLSYLWAQVPAEAAGGKPRGLVPEPVRRPALPHVLQAVHGEGVGHAVQRSAGRMGAAAHRPAVAGDGGADGALRRFERDAPSSASSSTRAAARG